jgi:hypothetical protein
MGGRVKLHRQPGRVVGEEASNDFGVDRQLTRLPADLHRYLMKVWEVEDWEELDLEDRRRLIAWMLKLISADAAQALQHETLGHRGEEHVSRTVSLVDERGWHELARIQDEALGETLAVKAESAERLAESGEVGMLVLSSMLCFEMAEDPPETPELPERDAG